jgi:hypothetical protein
MRIHSFKLLHEGIYEDPSHIHTDDVVIFPR